MKFDIAPYLKKIYQLPLDSHKGQNGKLLIIGGSHLFHAASLWSLKIASRIVDMVFYSSVPENNEIVQKAKEEFRDGIVVRRDDLDHYIKEADCVLVGCGMNRQSGEFGKSGKSGKSVPCKSLPAIASPQAWQAGDGLIRENPSLREINQLENEGEQTYWLTHYVLTNYHDKRFVIDAGALQELRLEWLKNLKEPAILTPHQQELERLVPTSSSQKLGLRGARTGNQRNQGDLEKLTEEFNVVVLVKGRVDKIYAAGRPVIEIEGGAPGMTKGGTGDVLAGLIAGFYCKSEAVTSAVVGSFFNKKAGEELFETMGNFFNASDLVEQLPKTMKEAMGKSG